MPSGVADLFERILIEASSKKRGRKPADWKPEEQKKNCLKEQYLLAETNYKCPVCGKKLLAGGSKAPVQKFECVNVIPARCTSSLKAKCEATGFAFPQPDSLSSFIALCPECASEYHTNQTPEMYEQLMRAKHQMKRRMELNDALDRLEIEDGITALLRKLGSLEVSFDEKEATLYALEIKKKIKHNELLLTDEILNHVLKYYHFIQNQFQQLEAQNILDFETVRNQIRGCYLKLEKSESSQVEIVELMSKWLAEKTRYDNILACHIVISFFVQSCEVFREITE